MKTHADVEEASKLMRRGGAAAERIGLARWPATELAVTTRLVKLRVGISQSQGPVQAMLMDLLLLVEEAERLAELLVPAPLKVDPPRRFDANTGEWR